MGVNVTLFFEAQKSAVILSHESADGRYRKLVITVYKVIIMDIFLPKEKYHHLPLAGLY